MEICSLYKYLGVLFNNICDIRGNMFRGMSNYVCDSAHNTPFATLNKCNGLGKISSEIGLKLADTFVLPVIEYGSEIWNYGREISKIQRVQFKLLKMLLGVKQSTATCAIPAETGHYPLYVRGKLKVLTLYFRIVTLNNLSVLKHGFLQLHMFDILGFVKNNWLSNERDIFIKLDLLHYYEKSHPSKRDIDH